MRLVTHSGTFHADDVFAYAVLSACFPGATLVRTRDEAEMFGHGPAVVFDVGGACDPSRGLFDHHMRDKPLRDDGTPYSSFGMVWRAYGERFLESEGVAGETAVRAVWSSLDRGLVVEVDRLDNGIGQPSPGDVAALVDAFNPAWDDALARSDERFAEASSFAAGVLRRQARRALSAHLAEEAVEAAALGAEDPRIVVLPASMPWERVILSGRHPDALYVVYPRPSDGEWLCTAVPPEHGSFAQRLPLPEAWGGLRGAELAAESGFADAVFCHPALFICGARSMESAVGMAAAAVALASGPRPAPR